MGSYDLYGVMWQCIMNLYMLVRFSVDGLCAVNRLSRKEMNERHACDYTGGIEYHGF